MGLSKKIFISYVEEDGPVAHEIASGLESQGYSSWYYERDCPAGADYFEETFKAISDCEAMVVVISPRSLPSDQVTREIVRAVETSKATLPLLLEISHDDYARRRPGWKQAMAAANAMRIPPDQIPTIIPALVAGLSAKGIRADANAHGSSAALTPLKESSGLHPGATALTPPPTTTLTEVRTATSTASRPAGSPEPPWKIIAIAAVVVIAVIGTWAFVHYSRPKPVPPPPVLTTTTIVIQYRTDRHKCTPDLNVTIAGVSFHPASNPFAASGVKPGAQDYTIDGLINCPGKKAIKASGSGAIEVQENAVFDLAWQSKPSGGVSNVDMIRTADNSGGQQADNTSGDDENSHGSQGIVKPGPAPAPAPVAAPVDNGQQMFLNAQNAYNQKHIFIPPNDSALFWAIQSRNAGNQNGKALEGQIIGVYKTRIAQFYAQRNIPAAMQLNSEMLGYYPGDSGLLQDQQKLVAAANGGAYQRPVAGPIPPGGYPPQFPGQYQLRPGANPPKINQFRAVPPQVQTPHK
ncbi:MAG: toll/interleukin-1 receptor domain-containing protein [Candidatus Acidiferrales bacterium]